MKIFVIVLSLLVSWSSVGSARMAAESVAILAPPQPPANNPHPPKSSEEQARVDFAVKEIRAYYGPQVEIRHPHVIPWSWEKFQNNLKNPPPPVDASDPKVIIEAQSAHARPLPPNQAVSMEPPPPMPSPQLKADEYMVHAYVKFPQDPRWQHLDVILSEDAAGHISRRNFFSIPMPPNGGQLPPGVVC